MRLQGCLVQRGQPPSPLQPSFCRNLRNHYRQNREPTHVLGIGVGLPQQVKSLRTDRHQSHDYDQEQHSHRGPGVTARLDPNPSLTSPSHNQQHGHDHHHHHHQQQQQQQALTIPYHHHQLLQQQQQQQHSQQGLRVGGGQPLNPSVTASLHHHPLGRELSSHGADTSSRYSSSMTNGSVTTRSIEQGSMACSNGGHGYVSPPFLQPSDRQPPAAASLSSSHSSSLSPSSLSATEAAVEASAATAETTAADIAAETAAAEATTEIVAGARRALSNPLAPLLWLWKQAVSIARILVLAVSLVLLPAVRPALADQASISPLTSTMPSIHASQYRQSQQQQSMRGLTDQRFRSQSDTPISSSTLYSSRPSHNSPSSPASSAPHNEQYSGQWDSTGARDRLSSSTTSRNSQGITGPGGFGSARPEAAPSHSKANSADLKIPEAVLRAGLGSKDSKSESESASPTQLPAAKELDMAELFRSQLPAVVNVNALRSVQSFHSLDAQHLPKGLASGIIWDSRGHVVTAHHVVKGAVEVKVTLHDQTTLSAKVIGIDASKDLAVLRLSVPKSKMRELQPAMKRTDAKLAVGQRVLAIGNTHGLDHTLTQGIISGLGRDLTVGHHSMKNMIQTDMASGHQCGGALIDTTGNLVGIVSSPVDNGGRVSNSGGLGYALPIDSVHGIIEHIIHYGRPLRPALGISLVPPQVLQQQGLDGVIVLEVLPGLPAHQGGLRPTHRDIFGDIVLGDIIVAIDGRPVRSAGDLYAVLDDCRVGDRVKIDIIREGKPSSTTVLLGERDPIMGED